MVLQGFRKSLTREVCLHLTDFFKQKQDVAQALSARLNNAYQTLLYPLSRAEYILELNQLPMSELLTTLVQHPSSYVRLNRGAPSQGGERGECGRI